METPQFSPSLRRQNEELQPKTDGKKGRVKGARDIACDVCTQGLPFLPAPPNNRKDVELEHFLLFKELLKGLFVGVGNGNDGFAKDYAIALDDLDFAGLHDEGAVDAHELLGREHLFHGAHGDV